MNINQYSPCEEGTKAVFSTSENGCIHIGNNTKRHSIRKFRIDGDVVPKNSNEERCDYLLLNDTDEQAYYIELKGSDIEKAISQIENSIKLLHSDIYSYTIFPRIIYRTGTHDVHGNIVLRWRCKYHQRAIIHSRKYEENIS